MQPVTLDPNEIAQLGASVDWLTVTSNDAYGRNAMTKAWLRSKAALEMLGETVKAWKFRGYIGYRIGSVRWATREDTDIVILSGQDACAYWRIFAPLSTNCSRVDLAVTIKTLKCYPNLIRGYAGWIRENGSGLQKRTTVVERVDGVGQTLYVGSRKSDQFGRLYDKGAQANSPMDVHRLWRYEVEYKDHRAYSILQQLLGIHSNSELNQNIRSTVFVWFDQREVPPLFDRAGGIRLECHLEAQVTSPSQSLAWLSKQVRPTIDRLRKQGYEDDVRSTLGLLDIPSKRG